MTANPPSRWAIWAGMLVIYIVWSSTYLAIRFAVESMPPFLMAAVRFLLAGSILFIARLALGDKLPTRTEWRSTGLIGIFLLMGGNGGVVWAEQRVVSGIAALLIGTTPLWIVLVDALRPKGQRPGWLSLSGVLVGFIGIALLLSPWKLDPSQVESGLSIDLLGLLALLMASLSWAVGSVYSRQAVLPNSPLLATGMEMIVGGCGLMVLATLSGEWQRMDLSGITPRAWWALVYLVFIGALLGFAAYTWLLRVAPITLVSTYAYVNPLIAIFLGALLAQEEITSQVIVSALIIVSSVALITTANTRRARR